MRISRSKLNIELARRCVALSSLRSEGLSPMTLTRIKNGKHVKPATVGKIAKALGVDPVEIIEMEE